MVVLAILGILFSRGKEKGSPRDWEQFAIGFGILLGLAAGLATALTFALNAIYFIFTLDFWPAVSKDSIRTNMVAVLIGVIVFSIWSLPRVFADVQGRLQKSRHEAPSAPVPTTPQLPRPTEKPSEARRLPPTEKVSYLLVESTSLALPSTERKIRVKCPSCRTTTTVWIPQRNDLEKLASANEKLKLDC